MDKEKPEVSKLVQFIRSISDKKDDGDENIICLDNLENISRSKLVCQDKLGEGSFGSVHKGTWTLPSGTVKEVAIKQMNCGVTSSISYEDVLQEAQIQFKFNHSNIVNLYGISFAKEQLWLIMRMVKGSDLSSILFPENKKLKIDVPLKLKIKICYEVSNAIAYIHDQGFLHADIKPQNMMVDVRTGRVFICDFGVTRYLGSMDLQQYATKFTNSFGGTLLYVAPECLSQDKTGRYLRPTFKSDVWSLGSSFFEIFSEKHLFSDPLACLKCKTSNDSEYVQKLVIVHVKVKEVKKMVQKALDFTPSKRPTAVELSDFFKSLR